MKMLLKISWRNIWRHPKRSLVMAAAIAAGLWGGLMAAAIASGLVQQRFETTIEQHISHIQIHHPEYLVDPLVEHHITPLQALQTHLEEDADILAYSLRTRTNGMLATANLTRGIEIMGVHPPDEAMTTRLDQNMVGGGFFDSGGRNPVLVGQALAEKTRLRERSRLVLTFQDREGELVSASFHVAGIFRTANSAFDEQHVFVLGEDLNDYLGFEQVVHEAALLCHDMELIAGVRERLIQAFPSLRIRGWAEVSPELSYIQEMSGIMLSIILGIILFALAFGLVNTMLMSVFERIRELGMLMAVGMNKRRIFSMILLETTFLSLIGALTGIILARVSIGLLAVRGLDLAAVGGDAMREFGFPTLVFPHLEISFYLTLVILVIAAALLTALFPALKATRLAPAQAVRAE